ncbi:MAG: hypothetical protein GXP22_04285 [Gammaproteobacteria bacterium]|nr:hypothetical protein [Gammaproteobacteria bacterium]
MRINRLSLLMLVMGLASLLLAPAQASDESCISCHLHSELSQDFAAPLHDIKTLAGFHGYVFKQRGSDADCQVCHESGQTKGELPSAQVCLTCHTRGKSTQGDPDTVFHAEENHWPMEKVSCTTCHKGHVAGNRIIKFMTGDAINACQQCHKKSFKTISGLDKSGEPATVNEPDNRYGQN